MHLGVSEILSDLPPTAVVEQHRIHWNDDFAAARNELMAQVSANFVLWIDSDEILIALPKIEFDDFKNNIYAIRIIDNSDQTANYRVRFHRNVQDVKWRGSVHEQLQSSQNPTHLQPKLIPGILVHHDGYEDTGISTKKHLRNATIAAKAMGEREPTFGELHALAAAHMPSIPESNASLWFRCFKNPHIAPTIFYDSRVTPAHALCSFGYPNPALTILDRNPLILSLQLAVLADSFRRLGELDEERLTFVEMVARHAAFDQNHPLPIGIIGKSREEIVELVKKMADDWSTAVTSEYLPKKIDFDQRYVRIGSFEQEQFENDTILLHGETGQVIVLNEVAAVLWQALAWDHTPNDLLELLKEAQPLEPSEQLNEALSATLSQLLGGDFIQKVDAAK